MKEAEEKAAKEAEIAAEKAEKAEAKKRQTRKVFRESNWFDVQSRRKIPGKAGEVLTKPVDFMAEHVMALYAFLATTCISILYLILSPFIKEREENGREEEEVGKAKKTDEVQEDDDEEEEEEEEEKPKKRNGRSKSK